MAIVYGEVDGYGNLASCLHPVWLGPPDERLSYFWASEHTWPSHLRAAWIFYKNSGHRLLGQDLHECGLSKAVPSLHIIEIIVLFLNNKEKQSSLFLNQTGM